MRTSIDMTEDFSSEVDEVIDDLLPDAADETSASQNVTTPQTTVPDTASEDSKEIDEDDGLENQSGDGGANGEDSTSFKHTNRHREELWSNLDKPPKPANIISQVGSMADISDSIRKEAQELIGDADGALPIQRTRAVWALAAIKRGSEIENEPVDWPTLMKFTDIDKEELEARAEQFSQID